MSYVVYHKDSTKRLDRICNRVQQQSFKSVGAAKAAVTRVVRSNPVLYNHLDWMIAPADVFYKDIEKKEIRKGVIHSAGKDFEVGVNTPWTSGPWSETYHCS